MTQSPARSALPPLWLLALATILGTISNHMFVPALPTAAQDLQVSGGAMQLTISVYLVGLAVGQLIYGPLSDAFGRRPLLLAGLALFTVAGFAAALAPGLDMLLVARVAQALGGCAGIALGRAMVRDTTEGEHTVRQLGLLGIMVLVWPGVGPVIGGALVAAWGWRAIFLVLAATGLLTWWLALRGLPETRQGNGVFTLRTVLSDYRELLGCAPFVALALGGGAITTSIYAFLAAAPFILGERLHQSVQQVGIYSGVVMLGIMAGTGATTWLVRRVGGTRLLYVAAAMLAGSALLMLGLVLADALAVAPFIGAMLFFTGGIGILHPILLGKALALRPHLAGSASGFYGFNQMAMGAVSATLASMGDDRALSCVVVLGGATLFSCGCVAFALCRECAGP